MRTLFLAGWIFVNLVALSHAAPVPDFKLMDVNSRSSRRNTLVSPRDYMLQVSGYYFAEAHCSYCRLQFGYLNKMMGELRTNVADLNIEIVGVNRNTDAEFNPLITVGRTLPWLQDTTETDAWSAWQATWRDVQIVDAQNQRITIYNLTDHDLSDSANYAALKQMFLDAARATDVDGDKLPDAWELRYFSNLNALPDQDPDGDGVSNAVEFAFGTDPTSPNSAASIKQSYIRSAQQVPISVSFRRFAGGIFDYTFEVSDDLQKWSPATPEILAIQSPYNRFDGFGTAEVNAAFSDAALGAPLKFVRVRAHPRSGSTAGPLVAP